MNDRRPTALTMIALSVALLGFGSSFLGVGGSLSHARLFSSFANGDVLYGLARWIALLAPAAVGVVALRRSVNPGLAAIGGAGLVVVGKLLVWIAFARFVEIFGVACIGLGLGTLRTALYAASGELMRPRGEARRLLWFTTLLFLLPSTGAVMGPWAPMLWYRLEGTAMTIAGIVVFGIVAALLLPVRTLLAVPTATPPAPSPAQDREQLIASGVVAATCATVPLVHRLVQACSYGGDSDYGLRSESLRYGSVLALLTLLVCIIVFAAMRDGAGRWRSLTLMPVGVLLAAFGGLITWLGFMGSTDLMQIAGPLGGLSLAVGEVLVGTCVLAQLSAGVTPRLALLSVGCALVASNLVDTISFEDPQNRLLALIISSVLAIAAGVALFVLRPWLRARFIAPDPESPVPRVAPVVAPVVVP